MPERKSPKSSAADPSVGLKRRHIDHKPIAHVAFQNAFVGLVDFLNRDGFNIARNMMRAAKIQHFLGFLNAANYGTRHAAPAQDQRKRFEWNRFVGNTDDDKGAVHIEQFEIWIPVNPRRDGANDEVEVFLQIFESCRI